MFCIKRSVPAPPQFSVASPVHVVEHRLELMVALTAPFWSLESQ
jgi:hypothetical protein